MKEAGTGIEPVSSGFADRGLTTWLPRRIAHGPAQRKQGVQVLLGWLQSQWRAKASLLYVRGVDRGLVKEGLLRGLRRGHAIEE
jgi:hypothetical protein